MKPKRPRAHRTTHRGHGQWPVVPIPFGNNAAEQGVSPRENGTLPGENPKGVEGE
jgi:hypothetical protein